MEYWLATTNAGKVSEFKSLLMPVTQKIHTLKELPVYFPPEETGSTFKENALIKAKSLKELKPNEMVIAEDSGLEVEGLNHMPGVHSARYAGPKASDDENNAKLLKMVSIRTPLNRKAQFKCTIAVITPNNEKYFFEGFVEGEIAKKLSGHQGFGYDPCFIPLGEQKTFGELGPEFKNKVSHRKMAIKQLVQFLTQYNQ